VHTYALVVNPCTDGSAPVIKNTPVLQEPGFGGRRANRVTLFLADVQGHHQSSRSTSPFKAPLISCVMNEYCVPFELVLQPTDVAHGLRTRHLQLEPQCHLSA